MKKRYFNFIGIKNGGHQRLFIVSHMLILILITVYVYYRLTETYHYVDFDLDLTLKASAYATPILITLITSTIIFRIIRWIKEGYKNTP